MKISDDDLIWGSRSSLQKSIRRGCLDLCKTSFDLLWNDPKQRQWLKWRIYTLVIEEAFYLSAELYDFLETKTNEEKDWRKFIYQLCLAPKSKDNVALWVLYEWYPDILHDLAKYDREASLFIELCGGAIPTELNPSEYAEKTKKFAYDNYTLSDYEKKAITLLAKRASMGGMRGDMDTCIPSILLIAERHLDEQKVKDILKNSIDVWKSDVGTFRKPKTVELPWYAFDMHTQAGSTALNIFMKNHASKYGLTKQKFNEIWFWGASGIMRQSLLFSCADASNPSITENKLFQVLLDQVFKFNGKTNNAGFKLWESEICAKVQGCVEWILEKRSL